MDRHDLTDASARVVQAQMELVRLQAHVEMTDYQRRNVTIAIESLQRAQLNIRICAHKIKTDCGRADLEACDAINPIPLPESP